MKYLAILKDSLYEALDTKVFYVMVGLSCLVLLAVGSVSYAPVTVEDEAEHLADSLTWGLSMGPNPNNDPPAAVSIADFKQTNPQGPLSERDYSFTVILRHPTPRREMVVRFGMPANFAYLKDVKVEKVESPDKAEARFTVTTHGSRIKQMTDWPHEPTIFFVVPIRFWHAPVGNFVHFLENRLINTVGAGVTLLISVIITAFFIPNMLGKGTVDLLLVKPIHRSTLLIYKYIGGLAFMFLNTTFVVAGVWIILGLRTGIWGPGFLASIPVLTFQFALYYAFSTLAGVVTRSSIVAILMACMAWFFFSLLIGNFYAFVDATRKLNVDDQGQVAVDGDDDHKGQPMNRLPEWLYTSADVVHLVTPRLGDLDYLTNKLIVDDTMPDYSRERKLADKLFAGFHWSEALVVTTIYIVILLAVSCWWFATKDY